MIFSKKSTTQNKIIFASFIRYSIASLLVVLLLPLSSTGLSDELYVTNQGTYVKESNEPFRKSAFHPNAYYLKAGNMLYHLERQKLEIPLRYQYLAKAGA